MNERLKKRLESLKAPLETHFTLIKATFHLNLWFLMPLGHLRAVLCPPFQCGPFRRTSYCKAIRNSRGDVSI